MSRPTFAPSKWVFGTWERPIILLFWSNVHCHCYTHAAHTIRLPFIAFRPTMRQKQEDQNDSNDNSNRKHSRLLLYILACASRTNSGKCQRKQQQQQQHETYASRLNRVCHERKGQNSTWWNRQPTIEFEKLFSSMIPPALTCTLNKKEGLASPVVRVLCVNGDN